MPSRTLTRVRRNADGENRWVFGKVERVFDSLAQAQAWARDTLAGLDRDTLEAIAIALVMSRQPALGNPSIFDGKTVLIDFSQANWGTVS